jgi:hypothetical protein
VGLGGFLGGFGGVGIGLLDHEIVLPSRDRALEVGPLVAGDDGEEVNVFAESAVLLVRDREALRATRSAALAHDLERVRLVLAGLELVDALGDEPALRDYHLLPSVRGHLLEEVGRADEARIEFQRAAALTRNSHERALLRRRSGVRVA